MDRHRPTSRLAPALCSRLAWFPIATVLTAISFHLLAAETKTAETTAIVLTPEGSPAARAKVALGVAGSRIYVSDGEIDAHVGALREHTTAAGEFRFPPQKASYQLVISHPTGYAHVEATPENPPATIRLQPWARVEGIFRAGKNPESEAKITIRNEQLRSYKGIPRVMTENNVVAGPDGRFVFERVPPVEARIGRKILVTLDQGAGGSASACMTLVQLTAGKTTHIDLGGTGRPVIGQLQPPAGFKGNADWRFALIQVGVDLRDPPKPADPPVPAEIAADPAARVAWVLKWQNTPAGRSWLAWTATAETLQRRREASPFFTASAAADGSFRIDDVPQGTFSLSVVFVRNAVGQLEGHRFSVPPMIENRSDEPLDLGILTLIGRP